MDGARRALMKKEQMKLNFETNFNKAILPLPQVQPLPGPSVDENVPHLTVPHIIPKHLAALILLVHHD